MPAPRLRHADNNRATGTEAEGKLYPHEFNPPSSVSSHHRPEPMTQDDRTNPERADDTITTSIMPRMSELMPTRANDARIETTSDLDAWRNRQG